MRAQPAIVVIRLARLLAAWAGTIFWSSTCALIGVVGAPLRAWWVCPRTWGRMSCGILGVTCHVVGEEHLKPGSLFAQNHDSFSEVFTTPALLPRGTKFVAKQELSRIPFFGWGARMGLVWVDRQKGGGSVKALASGLGSLPADWSMFIFPEGTRSRDGLLGPFKKGVIHMALQSRRPLVPIGSYGGAGIVPPSAWLIRSGPVEFTVGPPLDTSGWTLETLDDHLAEIRRAILDLQDQSRSRYETKYGPLVPGGAQTALLELRGARRA